MSTLPTGVDMDTGMDKCMDMGTGVELDVDTYRFDVGAEYSTIDRGALDGAQTPSCLVVQETTLSTQEPPVLGGYSAPTSSLYVPTGISPSVLIMPIDLLVDGALDGAQPSNCLVVQETTLSTPVLGPGAAAQAGAGVRVSAATVVQRYVRRYRLVARRAMVAVALAHTRRYREVKATKVWFIRHSPMGDTFAYCAYRADSPAGRRQFGTFGGCMDAGDDGWVSCLQREVAEEVQLPHGWLALLDVKLREFPQGEHTLTLIQVPRHVKWQLRVWFVEVPAELADDRPLLRAHGLCEFVPDSLTWHLLPDVITNLEQVRFLRPLRRVMATLARSFMAVALVRRAIDFACARASVLDRAATRIQRCLAFV